MSAELDHPAASSRAGLSLVAYLGAAWLAALGARALAPALPGSAVGIADWIGTTYFGTACMSQLVAAGGIALCVRLLGVVLPLPGLGVGLRMVAAPTTLAIVALVVSAATRPLEPELTFVLGVALPLALLSPLPLLASARKTRAGAVVLGCAGLAGALELALLELERRGVSARGHPASFLPPLLDVSAGVAAVAYAAGRRRRLPLFLAVFVALALVPAVIARTGALPGAGPVEVLLYRSLEALSQPAPAIAGVAGHAIALAPFAASSLLFAVSLRSNELCVALGLCLLARTGPGTPLATLLGAGASLLAIRVFYVSFRDRSGVAEPAIPRHPSG